VRRSRGTIMDGAIRHGGAFYLVVMQSVSCRQARPKPGHSWPDCRCRKQTSVHVPLARLSAGEQSLRRARFGTLRSFPISVLNVRSCQKATFNVCPINFAVRLQLGRLQSGSSRTEVQPNRTLRIVSPEDELRPFSSLASYVRSSVAVSVVNSGHRTRRAPLALTAQI
jgi:hypothetical protein